MKTRWWLTISILAIVAALSSYYFYTQNLSNQESTPTEKIVTETTPTPSVTISPASQAEPTPTSDQLVEPVLEFKERITLKPFGIYITPENSPVQPERFSGYHNAVDVEYTDTDEDVAVFAIADGEVVLSRIVSGYGGATIIRHEIRGEDIDVMYAHLDPNSLPTVGDTVAAGEQIGIFGEGNTAETDFERKHLHFSMQPAGKLDLRGYVQNESELQNWYDPLDFY